MKLALIYLAVLAGSLGLAAYARKAIKPELCWCWSSGQGVVAMETPPPPSKEYVSYGSYGSEVDWNDATRIIALNYEQTQGKIIFYQQCVWCHSDTTPAGPSNRSNVTPVPPLLNDGAALNGESDATLEKVITEGGSAVGKSAMMPPYGKSLTQDEIRDLVAYTRIISVPAYRPLSIRKHSFLGR